MKQTMKSCILEQPDTIRRVCQNAEKVCDSVYSIVGKGPFDKIYLIGSGTSLHTAIAAKYAFTKWFNAEVQVFTPFDFLYYYPHYRLDEKTLILGISQTARSIGTIHCLEKGREYGARTVMVTAEPDNPGGKSAESFYTPLFSCYFTFLFLAIVLFLIWKFSDKLLENASSLLIIVKHAPACTCR